MITVYANLLEGQNTLTYSRLFWSREEADQAIVGHPARAVPRVCVVRLRSKTRAAFQELHLRASM